MTINPEISDYLAEKKTFPDKAVLNKEGAVTNRIYIILEGKAKIKKRGSKGLITIDTLSEGDFIGEMGLLKQSEQAGTSSFNSR